MATSFAKAADRRLRGTLRTRIDAFTKAYVAVLKAACGVDRAEAGLRAVSTRAQDENRSARITGNGAEFIVDAVMNARKRGVALREIQAGLEMFMISQAPAKARSSRKAQMVSVTSAAGRLFQELSAIAQDWEEDI